MNQNQLVQPSVPAPQGSRILKWLIIILILVILGGGGYWYYAGYKTGIPTPSTSSSSSTKNCSPESKEFTVVHGVDNHTIYPIINVPCEWISVSKVENDNLDPNYDIRLYPNISDQKNEEKFQNQKIVPSGTIVPNSEYVLKKISEMFKRNSHLIGIDVAKFLLDVPIIIRSDNEDYIKQPIFDKVLIEDKKNNGNEYQCYQFKQEEKFSIHCSEKIGENYYAEYDLFTNLENYDSDINNLYEIIETTTIKQ